jgi:hypothetical protein
MPRADSRDSLQQFGASPMTQLYSYPQLRDTRNRDDEARQQSHPLENMVAAGKGSQLACIKEQTVAS